MPPTSLDELLAAPALAPPEGVTPQFDHPPNRNSLAWGVTTACMVIATICLLLRLYARLWREKKIHVEEGRSTGPLELHEAHEAHRALTVRSSF